MMSKEFEKIVKDLMDKGILLRISRDSPRVSVVDVKLNNQKPLDVLFDAINTLNQYNTSDCGLYYELKLDIHQSYYSFRRKLRLRYPWNTPMAKSWWVSRNRNCMKEG